MTETGKVLVMNQMLQQTWRPITGLEHVRVAQLCIHSHDMAGHVVAITGMICAIYSCT